MMRPAIANTRRLLKTRGMPAAYLANFARAFSCGRRGESRLFCAHLASIGFPGVVAFEPAPDAFRRLQRNISFNPQFQTSNWMSRPLKETSYVGQGTCHP